METSEDFNQFLLYYGKTTIIIDKVLANQLLHINGLLKSCLLMIDGTPSLENGDNTDPQVLAMNGMKSHLQILCNNIRSLQNGNNTPVGNQQIQADASYGSFLSSYLKIIGTVDKVRVDSGSRKTQAKLIEGLKLIDETCSKSIKITISSDNCIIEWSGVCGMFEHLHIIRTELTGLLQDAPSKMTISRFFSQIPLSFIVNALKLGIYLIGMRFKLSPKTTRLILDSILPEEPNESSSNITEPQWLQISKNLFKVWNLFI